MPAKKSVAAKPAARKASAKRTKASVNDQAAAIEAERTAMASVSDPQSGGAQVAGPKPSRAAVKEHQQAVADQFAAADARHDPNAEAVRDASLSRQVRGW